MVRIGIVDDHQIVLDGVKSLLQDHPIFKVVLESTNPEIFFDKLHTTPVDIVLTDMYMPQLTGEQLAEKISAKFPAIKIIGLSMSGEARLVNDLISNSHIKGYLLKNITRTELVTALERIRGGSVYFSEAILQDLEKSPPAEQRENHSALTNRETEILKLIEQERTNKDIAEVLFISERTVETHRKNIYRKTGTSSIIGLIKYAYINGII